VLEAVPLAEAAKEVGLVAGRLSVSKGCRGPLCALIERYCQRAGNGHHPVHTLFGWESGIAGGLGISMEQAYRLC